MAATATPNRPTTRTEAYDRKLERVLAAGAAVIAREGFGRASIRQVAGEAGMSLAGLYHYFSSKDELLFLIQFHTFDSIVGELVRRLEDVGDPEARLRVVVFNHLEHFLSNMSALKVCVHEIDSLGGEYYARVQELRRTYFRTTHEIVESIGRRAGGSEIDARLATLYLFGMLNWIYMWYPAARGTSDEVLGEQVLALFLAGFLPRGPGAVAERRNADV